MKTRNPRPAHPLGAPAGISRREALASLLATGGMVACGGGGPADLLLTDAAPAPGETPFPDGVPLYRELYENWTRELSVPDMRSCAPRNPEDVARVSNWAAANGLRLRARGMRHNWSPLTVSPTTTALTPMLIADTTQQLNRVEMTEYEGIAAVRAETGLLVEDLVAYLEEFGYGWTAITAVGAVSLGGVLAIDGHGAAIPARGEEPRPQQSFGSLSNRILQMTVVAWDASRGRYTLQSFDRREPETAALMVHLGRSFVTEVVMAVEPNHNLRCQSFVDIPATEMFGPPAAGGRDIASFLDSAGRIESIWYPFTDNPWLKVWSVSPTRPLTARPTNQPYNYPFSDNIPDEITTLAQQLVTGNGVATPLFGQMTYAVSAAGLAATLSLDLWGPSKNTMLFIKPTTLRIHELSWALLTRRDQVQQVLHDHATEFSRRLAEEQAAGRYPINMPVEYRVTGVDQAADVGLAGAQTPSLSALRPHRERPDWDTVVWLSILTIPGTPDMFSFFKSFETWMLEHYSGDLGLLRPEWSKGWAYTDAAAWENDAILQQTIPRAFQDADGDHWSSAQQIFSRLDPAGIFGNAFLDRWA